MLRALSVTVLALFAACLGPRGRCDVFELKDGGRVVGDLVERTDAAYVIRDASGLRITLDRAQLERVVPQDDKALEYARLSRTAPDTADGHRKMVAWCREQGLVSEIDHHLRRIIDLDPDDEDARHSLGFQRVGGRWLDVDELKRSRGLILFEGKYRTKQDIAIRQRDDEAGDGESQWSGKLRTWRGWLDSSRADRVAEAQASFAAIDDPHAAAGLVKLLDDEQDGWVFDLLLETLGRLDDPLALRTLVAYSLEDDDSETRERCVAYLAAHDRTVGIVPYVQALKDKDNEIVNRAGKALGELGDPAAISPLIEALVTTHKYQVQSGSGPGQINAGFDPSGRGGGGLSLGGGPQIIPRDEENLDVLRALMKLSGGQNFDYDEQAWRHWFVDLQMREHANARRDQ